VPNEHIVSSSPEAVLKVKTLASETLISREVLATGRVVTMACDTVQNVYNEPVLRDIVLHPGGVCVLPMTPEGDLLLIQQFRYPTGETLWEFPAGKLDVAGESPEHAIVRELWEETGYHALKWEAMGYLYTAPGFCDERIYLFIAHGCTKAPEPPPRVDDEAITVQVVSVETAKTMARRNDIRDAKTLALLALL
jgi:ADP-ribose pyrophosphatase